MITLSDKDAREYVAARGLLQNGRIGLVEAATLASAIADALGRISARAEKELLSGTLELADSATASFADFFERYLLARRKLRARTRSDYRQRFRKLVESSAALREKPISLLTTEECVCALDAAFPSACQAVKGRALLSAVFNFAERLGVVARNPAAAIGVPEVSEKEIVPLTPSEGETLVNTAREIAGERAALAAGLMLYAGIRPAEMARLRRADIDLQERIVCITPRHSKTGGARHVSVFPPLMRLMLAEDAFPEFDDEPIVPANWARKWLRIRHACGWNLPAGKPWQQDVLRHTFASHHLKLFRDIEKLQLEMGHSTTKLLFSRYVNLRGITKDAAEEFFS